MPSFRTQDQIEKINDRFVSIRIKDRLVGAPVIPNEYGRPLPALSPLHRPEVAVDRVPVVQCEHNVE